MSVVHRGKRAGCIACGEATNIHDCAYYCRPCSDTRQAEHAAATRIVIRALKLGEMQRQPCEVCGKARADAHHDDYSKPLEVRWLCRSHHQKHHHEMRQRMRQTRAVLTQTVGAA